MHPIALELLAWYGYNRRDLPWRAAREPYHVWLSEIMLQQTRVDQGLAYFVRFTEKFPTVHHLADATEEEVLKLWQGLGYYSRARNLHAAAKQVVNEHEGMFPSTLEELRNLKGVGPYTAAAIASIAFGVNAPVVDGNVHRVMSRLFDIDLPVNRPAGHRVVEEAMNILLPAGRAGDFNQAVMEFGALYCTPKNPNCLSCVLRTACRAAELGTVPIRPVKAAKAKVKPLAVDYFVVTDGSHMLMRQRTGEGIWRNLYDFPSREGDDLASELELRAFLEASGLPKALPILIAGPYTHLLSHRKITARLFKVRVDRLPAGWPNTRKVSFVEALDLPVPRLVEHFLALLV